ncbi:hypothetical protein CONCODRAFT_11326 [Conidiobolus coronatus NRRL 28638]|uniref:DUF1772-domain-containing protein n=1 Tax=Conidiobolus coronatus (strain ATCC 28846 / CBS 209.66 / NRRL 28638) TaxID=796925 RepID=A0A137NVH1_CONC2|nr:hypothetical protein CONCODRAFT_11326 [Conidiobolus coronatus NRRL 28638]|eukprot:KXN66762.1 hypothetical protein CONCODRAFT_11326 [Conidiobolus coronatus NRRL 28638]
MHIDIIRNISLLCNGIFAGTSVTISLSSVPAIKECNDKLNFWHRAYSNSTKIAVTNILISSFSHVLLYYSTGNTLHLYAGFLSFVSVPFTCIFISPIDIKLLALRDKHDSNDRSLELLLSKWCNLQLFRTIFGLSAFMFNIYIQN